MIKKGPELVSFKKSMELGVVAHACVPALWKAEAGGSQVQPGNLAGPYF